MKSHECALIQKLITDLDNTGTVYAALAPLLSRPHLKFLVERIANSHATIACHLAGEMDRGGGRAVSRGANALAGFGARLERWIAVTNIDVDLGCLKRIARHEARVTKRFRETLGSIKRLDENLHRDLGQLERMLFRIGSFIQEMEMPVSAASRRRAAAISLPTHERYRS